MAKSTNDTDTPLVRTWEFGSPEWYAHGRDAEDQDDISDAELRAIHDQVEAEITEHGLPTEDEIRRKIEALNNPASTLP